MSGVRMARRRARGFSLVEMMFVVLTFGILVSLAMPNYVSFMCKARQNEARGVLNAIAVAQTTYNGEYGSYLDVTALTSYGPLDPQSLSGAVYYRFTFTTTDTTWQVVAADQKLPVNPGGPPDVWSSDVNHPEPANQVNACH
ncbi:MAG: type IV pilin protein [Myxococcota bacterium]